jgi:hypothetical protein
MKRLASLALALCLSGTAAQALEGSWVGSIEKAEPSRIYLSLSHSGTSNMGAVFSIGAFTGLSADQMRSTTETPVRFSLDREAGRVDFEGTFRVGKGSGRFTFVSKPDYLESVRKLGVRSGASNDERLFALAMVDVSIDYIRSMIAEGYQEPLDEYQTMRIFDVTPEHIRAMREVGFERITAEELVASRIHGITPEFVREMKEEGLQLSFDELQSARIHGVTPEFRDEMAKLGYRVSFDQLTAFRIHGVTPGWISELKKLGYDHVDADDLVSTRIFGVTPEFIRSVAAAGFRDLPMSELISMRVHGLDADDLARRHAM